MALNTELSLQDYWRIIRRRKTLFLGTWGLVLGTTLLYTQLQTPIYRAQATIKIDPAPSIAGLGGGVGGQWDVWALMNTEVKSIRSTAVAEKAARRLGLIEDNTPKEEALGIAKTLEGQIQSERVGESNLLQISVLSDDAHKAAAVANAVVAAYIEKSIEDKNQKARETKEFTYQEMLKAEKKLREAEDNLKKYTERSGARGVGAYLTNQLVSYQTKLDDLLKSYTPQHPDVIETKARIKTIQNQMHDLPEEETEMQRYSREVRINEELYTFLAKKYKESQIAESEREASAFIDSPAPVPKSPIRPNKRLNLAVGALLGLFLGLVTALVAENLDTSIGTIEDVEHYLALPVLAVVPHIVADPKDKKWNSAFTNPKSPLDPEVRKRLVLYHPLSSSFAEAYHTLRTNLQLTNRIGMRPGVVIGFTSAGMSEGKTLTAVNFALTAAQSGMATLFVEGDLRRPSAHKLLGLPRDPGLSESIRGSAPWRGSLRGTSDFLMGGVDAEHILKAPGIENFRFLSAGAHPLNPADILGSGRFETMLREARQQFDLIVVDCAPVMLFADALLIGPRCDGLVLVYKAGRTARGALKRAKDQLVNVKTRVVGVVLNDLRATEMEPQYGYYYYTYQYDTPPAQQKKI